MPRYCSGCRSKPIFLLSSSLTLFPDFAPTIIASLGFSGTTAQLLTVPPNVFAFFIIIGNAWHSDKKKERPAVSFSLATSKANLLADSFYPQHILAGIGLVMIGYLLLATVRNWGGRYLGVFLIAW